MPADPPNRANFGDKLYSSRCRRWTFLAARSHTSARESSVERAFVARDMRRVPVEPSRPRPVSRFDPPAARQFRGSIRPVLLTRVRPSATHPVPPARSVWTPSPFGPPPPHRGHLRGRARRRAQDGGRSRLVPFAGHGPRGETRNPWLTFKHLTYEDTGKTRKWDMVGRSTRAPNAVADAVCVFAVLRKSGDRTPRSRRRIRPPLDARDNRAPELVGGGESPEQTAIRELKEETGTSASSPRTPRTRVW